MTLSQVIAAAPPKPACFPDSLQWAAYLLSCQESAKREVGKPFRNGEYKPEFNFCADCDSEHRRNMSEAGRCNPKVFRIAVAA
jgi:hypothetical protein